MQELLGRLGALDPAASQQLRVVACFDELMAGAVGTRGLLSAAAALAGCAVGFRRAGSATQLVGPGGDALPPAPPSARAYVDGDVTVWFDRATAAANDAIIAERLLLALQVRYDDAPATSRRDLALLLDETVTDAARSEAAARHGLHPSSRVRVVAAPLFAQWERHPSRPEDVIATPFGPVHVVIVSPDEPVAGSPLGVGVEVVTDDLPLSFRTAVVALRLSDTATRIPSRADDLGGLAEMLADLPVGARPDRDERAIGEAIATYPWSVATISALLASGSLREAARAAGVHHSTMASRIEHLDAAVGFGATEGMGRTRLALAFLRWRLSTSRVLELPPPA